MSEEIVFQLGEKFESFESLETKINNYSRKYYIDLYKRDARKITSAVNGSKPKLAKGKVSPAKEKELIYYEIKYSCLHGGKKHKSKSTGQRQSSTFRVECPFSISLRLDKTAENLEVTTINLNHENHEIDSTGYKFLPKVRKLSIDEKEYAENMLNLNVNKKKLQQQLKEDTGKNVLLKDLSNIAVAAKKKHHATRNNLDVCVKELRQKYNCTVDILTNENKDFCGLFAQDEEMKDTFSSFPEIIFVDATYKLLELQFPVYIFAVEDSNGQTEIVALGMLVNEDEASLRWLIETFKSQNPQVSGTRLVMADKDVNERHVINEVLPHVKLLICLFHALRTFNREIGTEKMGIKLSERTLSLQYIQKLCYAKSDTEYNTIREQFLVVAPSSVKNYFETNWHPIRDEWVMGKKFTEGNFLNATNNRLESLNGKLKQVITKYSSLEQFIKEFFIIIPVLRNERSYKAWYSMQKKKVTPYSLESPQAGYSSLLTNYASNFVLKQLDLSNTPYEWTSANNNNQTIQTSEGIVTVSNSKCSCLFFKSMLLPCRHIFSFRKKNNISLFDPTLCNDRWTNLYYRSIQKKIIQEDAPSNDQNVSIDILPQCTRKKLNVHQKFSIATSKLKTLANTISMLEDSHFKRKLEQIDELNNLWAKGAEVGFQDLGKNLIDIDIDHLTNQEVSPNDINMEVSNENAIEQDFSNNNINESNVRNLVESEECDFDDVDFFSSIGDSISGINHSDAKDVNQCLSRIIETICSAPSDPELSPHYVKPSTSSAIDKITTLDVKMPVIASRKGRPKGSAATNVIGLKKKGKEEKSGKGPKRYLELSIEEKQKLLLTWSVGENIAKNSRNTGNKIELKDLDPTNLSSSLFSETVCIKSVKYMFNEDAWEQFFELLSNKKECLKFQCTSCGSIDDSGDNLTSCSLCLKVFHFVCVKRKKSTKKKTSWFCNICKLSVQSDSTETIS